ncbi:hypothetical protein M409DRAFT_71643 [Zasmidium cellare ATCC 36951]|uniref:Plasma membrane iron permease n=1 Tax=Zasmidium cellare ATCC 36951 TaxID=1080233 RepID=A0A6A6BWW3_ZASCE|nr:uncharacterized protein M409DRAFT_71643 [Zasmidium cellare ATCC 36951]KAF2158440.1 hypothetical protein M409DRAFT_71643 [Zasmidium cellare ATCC 36951]
MVNVFAVPVFFICLRESLECAIIVAILLSFVKQVIDPGQDPPLYRKLVRQIWYGVLLGIAICIAVGAGMIGAWYGFGKNHFSKTEDIWEGCFALLATVIISFVGIGLLRVSKLTDKWRLKIAQALEKRHRRSGLSAKTRFDVWCRKYAMVLLPLVTVLREGLEAVVFIGGVGLTLPATSFPIAVIAGLGAGAVAGYVIYRFWNSTRLQIFLIVSTCFLYLIAAGLFSKSVWYFENYAWSQSVGGDAAETGSGAGSYDIRQSVWHVNCCNPLINGGGVIVSFGSLGFYEKRGHWPFMKGRRVQKGGNVDTSGEEPEAASEKSGKVVPIGEDLTRTLVVEVQDN